MEIQDNRQKILECALNLFAARGYDAVGIQEVVVAAGVTKPTLYHYFGNKQGLLENLLAIYFAELSKLVQAAATYNGDLPLTLTNLAQTYFSFATKRPTFYRLQLALWFAPPESEPHKVVAELNQQQYRQIEAVFEAATNEHGNMRGRHRAYAATFLGMLNTYVGLFLNGYLELNDAILYQAVHQFMHGIFS